MASLLDEVFAERDRAASAAAPARPAARMNVDAYRAASAAQRAESAANTARLREMGADLAERKFQYEMGRDASQDVRRAEEFERRATDAEGRAATADIRTQIAQEKAELDALKVARADERELDIVRQARGFLMDARGMRPTAKEFDDQLDSMLAGYPDALEHPAVKNWFDYNTKRRAEHVDRVPLDVRVKEAEEMSAAQARGTARGRPKSEDAEDSWVKLNAEKKAAEAMRPGLTPETARQFQKREQALISAGRDVPSAAPSGTPAPAAAPASYFKEGDTRVREGVTWKRNANGQWHPQS